MCLDEVCCVESAALRRFLTVVGFYDSVHRGKHLPKPRLPQVEQVMSVSRLRVAFVTPGGTAGRGGMGRMAHYLTQELQRSNPAIQLRVYDSYGPGRALLMPFYFFKCFVTLAFLGIVRPPHVLHLNMAAHGSTFRKLLLMRVASALGVPAIVHIHASKFVPFCDSLSPGTRRLLVRSLSRASQIVVIGNYWRHYVVDTLGVPAEIVTVLHNAVPLLPAPPPRANRRCRIVALGLLGARKGTPDLLRALATPALRELEWEALIAGNGSVEESRALARSLGILERVEIPGWVDADTVARALACADVFVLPSHNEGLPVAILEAMAAELPVVATPVGAIAEVVVPDETGYLVPAGDSDALADALARLVKNTELRVRLGQNGRKRLEQNFRIEIAAERFMTLYRELAQGDGAPIAGSSE